MLTDQQLQVLERQAAKPGEAGAEAKELYELARLGVWARDTVIPTIEKLPADHLMLNLLNSCPKKI